MAGKTPEFVIPAERLKRISDYIEQRGNAKISDLAQELGVSESTVRRDLDTLVREGLIQRSHGGATWIRHSSSYEHVYSEKMLIRGDEKKRIGAFCAEMVRDGDTLFLDSGTTTFQIAAGLRRKKDLTIFTYDLAIASTVEFAPSTTLVVTGGIKRENYNVLIGSVTEDFISRVRFSTAVPVCRCHRRGVRRVQHRPSRGVHQVQAHRIRRTGGAGGGQCEIRQGGHGEGVRPVRRPMHRHRPGSAGSRAEAHGGAGARVLRHMIR